jgi:DNA-binding IclR family transcriptional regulator
MIWDIDYEYRNLLRPIGQVKYPVTMGARPKQQGIQSIEVGFRLLKCLSESQRAMMLRDLAAAARMPAAKAHRYLVSMTRMHLVEQQPDTGKYDLGAYALELGLSALGRLDPLTVAAPLLSALHEEIEQTVALAVWANRGATIVRWIGSDSPVSATLRVGSVMPLTRSATGMVFLAFLPKRLTAALLADEIAQNANKGLVPKYASEVERIIELCRRKGFARTDGFIPGISGLAMPVFDHSKGMQLALITLGYAGTIDLADGGKIVAQVRQKASELSARLGHNPT